MILVDSSVWIDFFNGFNSPEEVELERILTFGEDIFITGIIASEVLSGIKNKTSFEKIKMVFYNLSHIHPDFDSHVYAAEIYRNLRTKGITIRSIVDCLIASIAIKNKLKLLQKDRDFEAIRTHYPSLRLIDVVN